MKNLYFMGSSRDEIRSFPKEVKQEIGFSLENAQLGQRTINSVPLVGFHGAGIVEVISDYDGNAYRTVYTVRFGDSVYVLNAFKKKSKRGIKTPKKDLNLIKSRLKDAEKHYKKVCMDRVEKSNVARQ